MFQHHAQNQSCYATTPKQMKGAIRVIRNRVNHPPADADQRGTKITNPIRLA